MADELTVEILKQIRDGITSLDRRMDLRLERVEQRLGSMDQRLERVEQGLTDLGKFMRQIALDQTRHETFHHQHVEVLEKDVGDLKVRVKRLEKRPSSGRGSR